MLTGGICKLVWVQIELSSILTLVGSRTTPWRNRNRQNRSKTEQVKWATSVLVKLRQVYIGSKRIDRQIDAARSENRSLIEESCEDIQNPSSFSRRDGVGGGG